MSGIRTSVPCSRHTRLLTHEWARAQLVTIGYNGRAAGFETDPREPATLGAYVFVFNLHP
jgi:hypothetical protein